MRKGLYLLPLLFLSSSGFIATVLVFERGLFDNLC